MTSSWQEQFDVTCSEIKRMYQETIEPVERKYQYELFKPTWFSDTLKPAKPFILFLGPFSAGKSTFINYLLGHDHLWTGPQPTTDKFTVLMHGSELNTISGRILASNPDLPFRGLAEFGNQFLETFSGLQVPAELLRNVSLIDTPGVLESAKEVHTRNYDYIKVSRWFIERADLVFVLFDPSKLDAGVELRSLFQQLKGHESKLRMVLNKADQCEPQELMRVYGSLFWSLSNLIQTTEPPRVYVSSFWNKPYRTGQNRELFDEEKADLMYDLLEVVPLQCLDKRVTAVMRRALDVQIHAHVVGTMKEKLPSVFGKSKAKKEMLANMDKIFGEVAVKYKLTAADFPKQEDYVAFFEKSQVHLSDMPKLSDFEKEAKKGGENLLSKLERIIRFDLPKLLHPIAQAAAVDPRKARKEKQGQGNAPPDKSVYVDTLAEQNVGGMNQKVPQPPQQPTAAQQQPLQLQQQQQPVASVAYNMGQMNMQPMQPQPSMGYGMQPMQPMQGVPQNQPNAYMQPPQQGVMPQQMQQSMMPPQPTQQPQQGMMLQQQPQGMMPQQPPQGMIPQQQGMVPQQPQQAMMPQQPQDGAMPQQQGMVSQPPPPGMMQSYAYPMGNQNPAQPQQYAAPQQPQQPQQYQPASGSQGYASAPMSQPYPQQMAPQQPQMAPAAMLQPQQDGTHQEQPLPESAPQ